MSYDEEGKLIYAPHALDAADEVIDTLHGQLDVCHAEITFYKETKANLRTHIEGQKLIIKLKDKEIAELKECAVKNNAEHMRVYYEAADLRKEIKELKAELKWLVDKHMQLLVDILSDVHIKELTANNERLREHIKQGMEPAEDNYECEVYMEECWAVLEETKSQSLREIEANAIEKAAELVSDELVKEEFPTIQALAMGRFYSDIIDYANKRREKS